MSRASPARVAAARALGAVDEGAHLEDVLAEIAPAPGPDRDLAWFLAFGVVRRRGQVDAALRPQLSRPIGSLDAEVRSVLRLGAFERLFARTKPHAVVHQAVEVARVLGVGRASGLVNAVLRRVAPPLEPLSRADAWDHPEWLVARWTDRYGADAAEAWCRANGVPPPLFVVTRDPDAGSPFPEATAVSLGGRRIQGCWRVAPSPALPIPQLAGFAEGAWWVQDAAAVAMADLVPVSPGMRVLDACAAPGGKAFRLASQGAAVTAVDRDPVRVERMRGSVARLTLPLSVEVHDWASGPWGGEGALFDAVLVDAPCTALGTVGRHPEIRWRRQPSDLARAAALQGRILSAVAEQVGPQGALVYTVCSPEPEEGPDVVARFLAEHPVFVLEEERTTAPPEAGEDGHFGVRLRRTG